MNTNGTFVWLDGTRVPLKTGGHWKNGEPSDPDNEHCIELRKQFQYKWNDRRCHEKCCPICESF